MQVPEQLVNFLTKHRGNQIPSPALLGQIGDQFAKAVRAYDQANGIPIVHFEAGQRKDEIAQQYRQAFTQQVADLLGSEYSMVFESTIRYLIYQFATRATTKDYYFVEPNSTPFG